MLSETLKAKSDNLISVECLDELQGGISGGTIATLFESFDEEIKGFQWRSLLDRTGSDIYRRLPDGSESKYSVQSDLPLMVTSCRNPSSRFGNKWTSPFIMSYINLDVVRRGVALFKDSSTTPIKYREAAVAANIFDAFTMWFGLILICILIVNHLTRPIMKMILPQPGQGPSEGLLKDGYLCVTGYGVGAGGTKAESVLYFPHDGGYMGTATMLVESGICLALDAEMHEYDKGGFYSPASIMCYALLDRLVKAGASFACRVNTQK